MDDEAVCQAHSAEPVNGLPEQKRIAGRRSPPLLLALRRDAARDQRVDGSSAVVSKGPWHPPAPDIVALGEPADGAQIKDPAQFLEQRGSDVVQRVSVRSEPGERRGGERKRPFGPEFSTLPAAASFVCERQRVDPRLAARDRKSLSIFTETQAVQLRCSRRTGAIFRAEQCRSGRAAICAPTELDPDLPAGAVPAENVFEASERHRVARVGVTEVQIFVRIVPLHRLTQ